MRRNHGAQFCLAAAIALACGCRASRQIRDPEYQKLASDIVQSWQSSDPAGEAIDPVVDELAGRHPVEDYIRYGLTQNPTIQAARLQVDSLANLVPVAASLQDPTLGANVYVEPVQTAAGQQEVGLTAAQNLPWFGKLSTRADVAEQETEVARAQLAAAELDVVDRIKRAYYQLYFVEHALRITEEDKSQLDLIERIVDRKYRVERNVSQQDLLRVQVEVARLETEIVEFRQQVESAQAALARQLHVSPDTRLRTLERLPAEELPRDLTALYRRAVAARPELHALLAAVERDRRVTALARLDYYPDVTLGATWIDTSPAGISAGANGRDAFLIGVNVNLPIYRARLESAVRSAETKAVSTARLYDSVKDQTLEEIKDLFEKVTSQEELLQLFREDIIPKARQTLEQSITAYQVGEVDFLQMIDNWRELLQFQITEKKLETQLRQSLASLARVLGGTEAVLPPPAAEPVPLPDVLVP
ncbi:MAG: TolC family protein [Pirellulales bacterium]